MIEPIFDDSTDVLPVTPSGFSTGYKGMFRSAASANELTMPFPRELLIPRSEWQARCEEMAERKTRVSDLVNAAGLPCKDQGQTNYCWANAPVHCIEIMRVIQNQPMVILSPASVAAPITGYKNQGGWGEDALRYLIEHGAVPVTQWPANAIDSKYHTDPNLIAALEYRCIEWWNLKPRSEDELISCLLHRFSVACGYNWQGHETTAVDPVWHNGKIGTRNRNSWSMNWPSVGGGGWYILQGSKMLADDACAPRVVTAS